jgi:RNA polymerase sigma factor (sigma-70 family)
MGKLPEYLQENMCKDKDYYSLYSLPNLVRCKTDTKYLGEVIIVNEKLIWHSIHKYVGKPEVIARNNGLDKDDIYQLAVMGLIKAVKAFDVDRGIKFSSFAVTAMYREVRCYIRDSSSIIRLSRTAYNLLNDIKKAEDELGYSPNTSELALLLNEGEDKIIKALQIGKSVKYLSESIPVDGLCPKGKAPALEDVLVDRSINIEADAVDKFYMQDIVRALKPQLSNIEFKVLLGQLGGLTQAQIADQCEISSMKVSRSMRKIMGLARNYLVDINC